MDDINPSLASNHVINWFALSGRKLCSMKSVLMSRHFKLMSFAQIEWVGSIFPPGYIANCITNYCTVTWPSRANHITAMVC